MKIVNEPGYLLRTDTWRPVVVEETFYFSIIIITDWIRNFMLHKTSL